MHMGEGDQGVSELIARRLAIETFITYQEGSVVSRTLIDKEAGTVTLFSFDEGQALSEHTAPYDALVLILDGEAKIRIAGEPHVVRAGEFIIMPGGEPHSVEATQKFKMLLVMVRSEI